MAFAMPAAPTVTTIVAMVGANPRRREPEPSANLRAAHQHRSTFTPNKGMKSSYVNMITTMPTTTMASHAASQGSDDRTARSAA
jgi:hypothetical protein